MKKKCVFAGTFDPPTLGHKDIVLKCLTLFDEVIAVSDADAYACGRELAVSDGVFTGISAGAAVYAALCIARRPENAGKRIAVIIPDTGARYLSTQLFSE